MKIKINELNVFKFNNNSANNTLLKVTNRKLVCNLRNLALFGEKQIKNFKVFTFSLYIFRDV